jgi:hypothetical protein
MAALETVLSPTGKVNAARVGVVTPFQYVFTGEDVVRWRTYGLTNLAGQMTAELTIRTISAADGSIQVTRYTQPSGVGVAGAQETVIPLGVGAIVNLAVRYTSPTIINQPVYATVHLMRGMPPGALTSIGQLLGGYLGPGKSLAWPGSPIESWWAGGSGAYQVIPLAASLGSEAFANFHVPFTFRLLQVVLGFTTSATVVNRFVTWALKSFGGATTYFQAVPLNPQAASLAWVYFWTVEHPIFTPAFSSSLAGSLPQNLIFPFESTFTTVTSGLQAADFYSGGQLYGELLIGPAVADG